MLAPRVALDEPLGRGTCPAWLLLAALAPVSPRAEDVAVQQPLCQHGRAAGALLWDW